MACVLQIHNKKITFMIKNLLKITIRNFQKQKTFSIINILGLSVGLACFILVMLWVEDEFSYENNHENADKIFMVYKSYSIGGKLDYNSSLPLPLGPHVEKKFPEIQKAVRIINGGITVSYEEKVFNEDDFCYADTNFFDVFTVRIIEGNENDFLKELHSLVITESIAKKYFGDENPIGKTLTFDQSRQFVVNGVIEDFPENTHINVKIFANIEAFSKYQKYRNIWGDQFVRHYLLIDNPENLQDIEKKIAETMNKQLESENLGIRLHPLEKTHLYSVSGKNEGLQYVITFSLIAIFIILLACINFMNLTTAKYSNRAREIGLKKVIGVSRGQLIVQFLSESVFMTFIAAIIAMMLAELCRPYFNEITGKTLVFHYFDGAMLLRLVALVLITGLLSGSYPALFLSKFSPAEILRKNLHRGDRGVIFRKTLVIIQFVISTALIFSTLIIFRQISFINNSDQGYQTEDILCFPTDGKIGTNYESFRNELLANPNIEDAGRCSELPCRINWIMRGIELEGHEAEEGVSFGVSSIDYGYISTLKLPLIEGRSFAKDIKTDSSGLIFNEEAIKLIGWDNPVGKTFSFNEDENSRIIGIVKDFHSLPLTNEIEPLVFLIWEDSYNYVIVRTAPGKTKEATEHIEKLWQDYASGFPFYCNSLENYIRRLYRDEDKVGKLAGILTFLALFISGLGLIGLTAYIVEQKYKEIGIRKVFGSSIFSIQYLLSSQFLKWVITSSIISLPIAWYLMDKWLNNFAYRIEIKAMDFILTILITVVIALLVTSLQVFRAAKMKPVDVLKYE